MGPQLDRLDIAGYEEVYRVTDRTVGLEAVIAIHSTAAGPAVGGTRIFPYPSFDKALTDALRLSKGMSEKNLLADLSLGGGKGVIIGDPQKPLSESLLRSYANAINQLEGRYFTAEDSGMTQAMLQIIQQETPFVLGLESEGSSGNPCPCTAWGTLRGIQATLKELTGSSSVQGKVIALQGVGFVGELLAELLFWEGADLVITDICPKKVEKISTQFDATVVEPEAIYDVPCDIFSPCALGAILNQNTIARLKCKGVAGSSNNQLATPEDGQRLFDRGILYAPDVIVNAGGIINVQRELAKDGFKSTLARDSINKISSRLANIFSIAKSNNIPPNEAVELVLKNCWERRPVFATTPS